MLARIRGLGDAKAVRVKVALELGRRLAALSPEERPPVGSPEDVEATGFGAWYALLSTLYPVPIGAGSAAEAATPPGALRPLPSVFGSGRGRIVEGIRRLIGDAHFLTGVGRIASLTGGDAAFGIEPLDVGDRGEDAIAVM
jgi:hypothetical protein